jgi:hypothetical protein
MILLKILFLISDLSLVIMLLIKFIKEKELTRRVAETIIIIALLTMWLHILVLWETKLIKIGGDNNANC